MKMNVAVCAMTATLFGSAALGLGQIPDPEANGLRCVGGCGSPSVSQRSAPRRPVYRQPAPEKVEPPKPSPAALLADRQLNQSRSRLRQEIVRLQTPATAQERSSPGQRKLSTAVFNTVFHDSPDTKVSFAEPLAKVETPASRIPIENLRRAAAIVARIPNGEGEDDEEDMAFLASQAAQALEGAKLKVDVSDSSVQVSNGAARRFGDTVEQLGRATEEWETAVAARMAIEKEIRAIRQGSEKPSDESLNTLSRRYEAALVSEKRASSNVKEIVVIDLRKKQ